MSAPVPLHKRVLEHLPANSGYLPRILVAADIETDGLGGRYLLGATLDDKGNYQEHPTEAGLFDYFMSEYKGGELLLHNADYDMRYIIPHIERYAQQGYITQITVDGDSRIIYCLITHPKIKGKWRIRDTWALLPKPLADLAPLAGMHKADIGLAAGLTFNPDSDVHREYLRRDVEMLLAAYQGYCKLLRTTFQVTPGYTCGGTALKAFRRTIKEEHGIFRQRPTVEAFARKAYFGGLTFYHDHNAHTDMQKIDINAAYATAMRQGVPTFSASHVSREKPGMAAIYRVWVTTPQTDFFAFVPKWVEDVGTVWGATRPGQTFETVIPSITMDAARKHGYEFEVIEGYVWHKTEKLFDKFISQCEQVEAEQAKTGLKIIVKELRNKLSGKLGQRPEGKQYWITKHPTRDMTPEMGLDGICIGDLYYTMEHIEAPHLMPHMAAWITAGARNILAEAVYALGPANCVYGDTDSIVVTRQALEASTIPIGQRYGEWKIVADYKVFQALGPKLYMGQDYTGAWELVHKGLPAGTVSPDALREIAQGGELAKVFPSLPRAIKTTNGRSKVAKDIVRTLRMMYNSDRWNIDFDTGRVTPVYLSG